MKIKVLGTGCAKCNKLHEETVRAVAETGVEAEAEHGDALDYLNRLGKLDANLKRLSESIGAQTGDLDDFFELPDGCVQLLSKLTHYVFVFAREALSFFRERIGQARVDLLVEQPLPFLNRQVHGKPRGY